MSLDRVRKRLHEWWSRGDWDICGHAPDDMSRKIKKAAHGKECPVVFCDHMMTYYEGELIDDKYPDAATTEHMLPRACGGVNEEWCLEARCNRCNTLLGQILNEDYIQKYGHISKVPFGGLKEFVDFHYRISSKAFDEKFYPDLVQRFKQKIGWVSQTQLTDDEMSESQSLASSLISEVSNEAEEVIS